MSYFGFQHSRERLADLKERLASQDRLLTEYRVCFSTQSGPHPEFKGRHWNHLQNRWCDGVPIDADRDPRELARAASLPQHGRFARAQEGGAATCGLTPDPFSLASCSLSQEPALAKAGDAERRLRRRRRSRGGILDCRGARCSAEGRSGHPVIAGARDCNIGASVATNRSTTMKPQQQYVGLDVSLEQTSVCVVGDAGAPIWRGKCSSTPEGIHAVVAKHARETVRIGLETGQLSTWLFHELKARQLPVTASTHVMPRPHCHCRSTRLTPTTPTGSRRSSASAVSGNCGQGHR
jgi:hypothetical protein